MEIKQQDAYAFLEELEPNSVDLVLTDPPYNLGKSVRVTTKTRDGRLYFEQKKTGAWDDAVIDIERLSRLIYRALRQGGSAIVWFDVWKTSYLADAMKTSKFKMLRMVQWNKTNPTPVNIKKAYLHNVTEMAVFGVKGRNPTFNAYYESGVYTFPRPYYKHGKLHLAQKPLKLFRWLVERHSNEGDLVIDPFLGSGTTAAACASTNRKFKGCDLDAAYIKTAKARVANYE